MTETVFSSNGAFLTKQKFLKLKLLAECVEAIKPLLMRDVKFKMYGRECTMRRGQRLVGGSMRYRFSGVDFEAVQPMGALECFERLLSDVNDMCDAEYTHILVNEYIDGSQYISDHADDEDEVDPDHGVVTLSFGATRKFVIREKKSKRRVATIPLISGELLTMKGSNFQRDFTHGVPKQLTVKKPRYSFTFRNFKQ